MSIYKDIYVSKKEPLVVEIAEGTNGIDIQLHVADWTIPTNATAQIYLEKPSGALIYNAASVEDNSIIISPTTQMTAEVGVNKGQLRIVNGTDILHSFIFYLKVEPSIIDDSAIESQDEFTALEEALSTVSDMVTHTELRGKGSAVQPVYFDADGVAQVIPFYINSSMYPSIRRSVTTSTLPFTSTYHSDLTENHCVVYANVSPANRQLSNLQVETTNGYFTISGTISGQVTIDLIFMYVSAR